MDQFAFYINTDICIGCKACMTACFDRNNLEVPQKFRKVWEFSGSLWDEDDNGIYQSTAFAYYVSMTCNQCEVAVCVINCPSGAMQKDPDTGIVNNDKSLCDGCMTCQEVCPYDHPVKFKDGLAHKCVLCTDQNASHLPDPACWGACPVRALDFGPIESLRAKYGVVSTIGTLEDSTSPNVVIGVHRDAIKGGTLANPLEVGYVD